MAIRRSYKKRRKEIAAQIAETTRRRRKELGYSQVAASAVTGVSLDAVKRCENPSGRQLPSVDCLGRYADGLGLSLAEIFADDA